MPCFSLKLSYDDFLKANFKKSIVLSYDKKCVECFTRRILFYKMGSSTKTARVWQASMDAGKPDPRDTPETLASTPLADGNKTKKKLCFR